MNEPALEQVMRVRWNADEYLDDHVQRGAIVAAMTLAVWREYPNIFRWGLARMASSAWIELRAFISYESGKFFVNYGGRFLRKLGCVEVFVHDYEHRLKTLGGP